MMVGDEPIPTWTELRTEIIEHALDKTALPLTVKSPDGALRSLSLPLKGVRIDPEFLFDDLGLQPFQPNLPARIDTLQPGDPAQIAGFEAGDVLLSYNDTKIDSWQQWALWVRAHPDEVVKLRLRRGDQEQERTVILTHAEEGGKTIGRFGASVAPPGDLWHDLRAVSRFGPLAALQPAVSETWRMSSLMLRLLASMVTGEVSGKNVQGHSSWR